ncbi:glutamyl-tRNA synthetase-related protein [Hahella chejuensis KCTC 2396]|uniref:Glutamyl-Q tRNA(Asp) synthetase n=1 Tax=Hahella chejuensis (strain KCTC 2396) TaxID=349521 RepID=Q2S8X0_HAHCH|nr:tRNA glutamyl-Q(34) synthetase GluQRS [Hahella chejuensis]ABC32904.1 glutamyl-tRNA synthetase-related protein [Hahella chejuensis KCTC 2396]
MQAVSSDIYRGRFAPSPTGPLHFGSLVGALASYLDARSRQGIWLVRIEDIDPLREVPGAADSILRTLEAHGMLWDESIIYQSHRLSAYSELLAQLLANGHAYPCPCSRKELSERHGRHLDACRLRQTPPGAEYAYRFAVTDAEHSFNDLIQGAVPYRLHGELDDFVIRRKEGFFSYQLAVVCDDLAQGVSHIIRGSDLLDSTPLQYQMYQALGRACPQVGHFPVVVDASGAKLSKQNLAPGLDNRQIMNNLRAAATALLIDNIELMQAETPHELLPQLTLRWSRDKIHGLRSVPLPDIASA